MAKSDLSRARAAVRNYAAAVSEAKLKKAAADAASASFLRSTLKDDRQKAQRAAEEARQVADIAAHTRDQEARSRLVDEIAAVLAADEESDILRVLALNDDSIAVDVRVRVSELKGGRVA